MNDKVKAKDSLEQKILHECLVILKDHGLSQLSLRAIAKSLDVSHSAPYRHFESKEHLLARLFEHGFQTLHQEISRDLPEAYKTDQLVSRFYLMLENIISFASGNPDLYLFMFGSCPFDKSLFPEAVSEADQAYELLCDQLKAMQANNLILPGDIDQQAFFTFSAIHGYASLLINGIVEAKGAKALNADDIKSYIQHNILRALEKNENKIADKAPFSY